MRTLLTWPRRFEVVECRQGLEKRHRFIIFPLDDFGVYSAQSLIDEVEERVAEEIYPGCGQIILRW